MTSERERGALRLTQALAAVRRTYRRRRTECPRRRAGCVPSRSSNSNGPVKSNDDVRGKEKTKSACPYLGDPWLPDLLAMHEHHAVIQTHSCNEVYLENGLNRTFRERSISKSFELTIDLIGADTADTFDEYRVLVDMNGSK